MTERRKNRILVALDMSRQSDACLAAAIELAAKMDAELQGLFIEDLDLINLSTLPFTRQILSLSATETDFKKERLEQDMKLQARYAQHALASMASSRRVSWSFEVVRGRLIQEAQRAADRSDLVVTSVSRQLANMACTPSQRNVAGALAQCSGTLVLVPEGTVIRPPFVVLIEPHTPLEIFVDKLVTVADSKGTEFHFVVAAQGEAAATLQSQISAMLDNGRHTLNFIGLHRTNASALETVLCAFPPGTIVMDRNSRICDVPVIQRLMAEFQSPVCLIDTGKLPGLSAQS